MKLLTKRFSSMLLVIAMILSLIPTALAAPSAVEIITTPTGYDSASDVNYVTSNGYIVNWGGRGEDCEFLSTYARSYYTGSYAFSAVRANAGGTSATNAPSSALFSALQTMMSSKHDKFTKYGGSSAMDCKNLYLYTDCFSSNTSKVSTLYQGMTVDSTWDSGSTYNQEHVWPQSKLSTANEIGDIMHLRPAIPTENSARGNKASGEGNGCYDPGASVRGDCA